MRKLILALMVLVMIPFVSADFNEGLRLCYSFNNDTVNGSTVYDEANDNDGTINGGVTTGKDCKIGECFEYDGNNGYIQTSPFVQTKNGTIEAWIYTDVVPGPGQPNNLFGLSDYGGGYGTTKAVAQYDQSGFISGLVYDGSSLLGGNTGGHTIKTNKWYHYVLTWQEGGYVKLYLNNTLKYSTGITNVGTNNNEYLRVGTWSLLWGASPAWGGFIDEFKIWDRQLSDDDISELFNNFQGLDCDSVVNYKAEMLEISSYNLTSEGGTGCTNWNTNKENACTISDTTPTVFINTTKNADCSIGLTDSNYTDMDRNSTCSGDGTKEHTCTLDEQDELSEDYSFLYIACKDTYQNENLSSSSGALKVYIPSSDYEADIRTYIESGISSALSSDYTIYTDQKLYARDSSNNQFVGVFDKVVKWMNKIWAFNYITGNDTFVEGFNVSPVLFVLELRNSSSAETNSTIYNLIINTK